MLPPGKEEQLLAIKVRFEPGFACARRQRVPDTSIVTNIRIFGGALDKNRQSFDVAGNHKTSAGHQGRSASRSISNSGTAFIDHAHDERCGFGLSQSCMVSGHRDGLGLRFPTAFSGGTVDAPKSSRVVWPMDHRRRVEPDHRTSRLKTGRSSCRDRLACL